MAVAADRWGPLPLVLSCLHIGIWPYRNQAFWNLPISPTCTLHWHTCFSLISGPTHGWIMCPPEKTTNCRHLLDGQVRSIDLTCFSLIAATSIMETVAVADDDDDPCMFTSLCDEIDCGHTVADEWIGFAAARSLERLNYCYWRIEVILVRLSYFSKGWKKSTTNN